MIVFRGFLLCDSLKFKEGLFRVEVFDFLQELSFVFFNRIFKHVVKLHFERFSFFETVLRSLSPALLKLLKGLYWHFLMRLNFRIFFFELIGIISICDQDVIWQGSIIDRVSCIGVIGKFFSNVGGKFGHVTDLLEGNKRNCMALLLSSGCTTTSMHEDLMVWWVIVLDDKVDWRYIETSGCDICNDQNDVAFLLSECIQVVSSLLHVHLTIHSITFVKLTNNWKQVVNVESSGSKDNDFLLLYDFFQYVK